jgi:hypothetical protein
MRVPVLLLVYSNRTAGLKLFIFGPFRGAEAPLFYETERPLRGFSFLNASLHNDLVKFAL